MKKHVLIILLFVSGMGVYAQNVGFEMMIEPYSYFDIIEGQNNEYIALGYVPANTPSLNYPVLLKINQQGDTMRNVISDIQGYRKGTLAVNQNGELFMVMLCDTNQINEQKNIHLLFANIHQEDLSLYNVKQFNMNILNESGSANFYYDKPSILLDDDHTIVVAFRTFHYKEMLKLVRMSETGDILLTGFCENFPSDIQYPISISHTSDHSGYYIWDGSDYAAKRLAINENFETIHLGTFMNSKVSEDCDFVAPCLIPSIPGYIFPPPYLVPTCNYHKAHPNGYIYMARSNELTHYIGNFIEIDCKGSSVICRFNPDSMLIVNYWENDCNSMEQITVIWGGMNTDVISFALDKVFLMEAVNPYSMDDVSIGIHCFDELLNHISEVFYQKEDGSWFIPKKILATSDGGCIIMSQFQHNVADPIIYGCIKKIEPEAFVSIAEAHANGLSVAIAYPNPGNNKMCIRTTVPKATIEVFDIAGKLVAQQSITSTETVFETETWQSGTYLWRVYSEGKLAETGKWIRR